jgi:hypothetical protein
LASRGAELGPRAAVSGCDVVAVDLWASGIRTLPECAFCRCIWQAVVACPPELESVRELCFVYCDALYVVDLAGTLVRWLGEFAFA